MLKDSISDIQHREAESWCLKNHIRVYPQVASTVYVQDVGRGKRNVYHVRLVLEINNARHVGTELYQQNLQMTEKIKEIYWHYYNKSGN